MLAKSPKSSGFYFVFSKPFSKKNLHVQTGGNEPICESAKPNNKKVSAKEVRRKYCTQSKKKVFENQVRVSRLDFGSPQIFVGTRFLAVLDNVVALLIVRCSNCEERPSIQSALSLCAHLFAILTFTAFKSCTYTTLHTAEYRVKEIRE